MTAENEPKIDGAALGAVKETGVESQDEIEQIMSEIEELQHEMNAAVNPTPSPAADSSKGKTAPQAASAPLLSEEILSEEDAAAAALIEAEAAAAAAAAAAIAEASHAIAEAEQSSMTEDLVDNPEKVEQEILKEFSGGGGEPWLEETLATLKTEESTTGQGVLDQAAAAASESTDLSEPGAFASEDASSGHGVAQAAAEAALGDVSKGPGDFVDDSTESVSSEDLHTPEEIPSESEAELDEVEKIIQEEERQLKLATQAEKKKATSQRAAPKLAAVPTAIPDEPIAEEIPDEVIHDSGADPEAASLAMNVRGKIAVRLNYGDEGQFVLMNFGQKEVRIQLSDGYELKVPIRRKKSA